MLMAVFVVCDIVHSVKLCQLLQVVNASFIVHIYCKICKFLWHFCSISMTAMLV